MAASSTKAIWAALIGNGLISITKFIAAGISGSSAMLSEGIHSVVDTGNQVLLLYGIKRSKLPADDRFPFGHGKEIYFWSFVVAIMIFAVGAGISLYEGIHHLLHPPEKLGDPTINYIVLGFAMVFEGFAWFFAFKEFKKSKGSKSYMESVKTGKDPTLWVVLFEDSAAMAGLIIAGVGVFLGQVTGIVYFDGAASVLIGLILGLTAVFIAIETKGLLIGESAEPEHVSLINEILGQQNEVDQVNEVITLHMGPHFVVANLSVDFKDGIPSEQIENAIQTMTSKIRDELPVVKRVFIEAESKSDSAAHPP